MIESLSFANERYLVIEFESLYENALAVAVLHWSAGIRSSGYG